MSRRETRRCLAGAASWGFLTLIACVVTPRSSSAQEVYVSSLIADGQSVSGAGGNGTSGSGGDLWHDLSCSGGTSGGWEHVYFELSLWMVDGSQVYTVATNSWVGYGALQGSVSGRVRASTQDRELRCYAYAQGTIGEFDRILSTEDRGTLLGSGPGSATIKVSAFIPTEYVGNPYNLYRIWEGDNRGFAYTGGTSRTTQIYDVFNPAVNDADILSGPFSNTGLSVEYDRDTSLTNPPFGSIRPEARNDWEPGYPMKIRWEFGDTNGMFCTAPTRLGASAGTSSHRFTCQGDATVPFADYVPHINWNFEFTLKWGMNEVEATIVGCHDGYPSYEIYGNGTALLTDNATSVDALWGTCDTQTNVTRVFR